MAVISDGRIIVTNASGERVSGGKLRIYNTGTTTLSDVYSDAALTTELENPVVADSNGVLPQIFATGGLTVDCTMLDASDATISGRSFTYTFVGASSSAQEYDFGNSRGKLSGSGGVFSVEAGGPTGDDSGGAMRLGGWDGSQAESMELDSAEVNTTGTFTENGKDLTGIVQTAGVSSGASTVVIALPNTNPVGCRVFDIDIIDVVCGSTGSVTVEFSFDNGATYASTGYYSTYAKVSSTAATYGGSSNAAAAAITSLFASWTAANPGSIQMRAFTPNGATGNARVIGRVGHGSPTTGEEAHFTQFHATHRSGAGRCTHVRLTFPGTTTCTYRVVPQRGFGE